jgi:hypothetical protein
MSEHEELARRLRNLADDASNRARLESGARIRRRAGLRRAGQVVGTAVVTGAVLIGAWAVAAPGSDQEGVVPAGPTTGDTSGPGPARPTDSPGASSATPQPPPPGGWVTTLPEPLALVLPHDGQKSTSAEESDWTVVERPTSWLLLPCDDLEETGYPSDPLRTENVAITQTGIESARAEQIGVYPSDVEAIQAMEQMRQALLDCADERTTHRADSSYTDSFWDSADAVDATSAGGLTPDEAFQAWNWNRTYDLEDNPTYGLGGGYFTVTRVGNAILLTIRDGETDWGRPDAAARVSIEESKTTRGVLSSLCDLYSSAAGC